jgi:hypothetical protein
MSLTARRWAGVALVAAPLCIAACGDVRVSKDDRSDATFATRDTNRTLRPGDVRIMNVDSSFELAVIGDSVVTGFGPKALEEIRKGTDTSAVTGTGFAANIEKMVKSTVAGAINKEIKYAVADIQSVRYENSKLEFTWKDGSAMRIFESSKKNGKAISETFPAAEANRFVAAFNAKKSVGAK